MSSTSNILKLKEENKQWFQYLIVLSACLCSFSTGLSYGWTSPYIRQMLSSEFHISLTSEECSYIASAVLLGYFLSLPLCISLPNRIGRKNSLLLISLPQLSAWIILGISNSFWMYVFGRALSGLGDISVYSLLPMYLGEICEPKVRGKLGTFFTLSVIGGSFVINIIGDFTTVSQGSFICAVIPILFFLTFIWMPESPYYLVMKNRYEDSENSLQKIRRTRNVDREMSQIVEAINNQTSAKSTNKYKDLFMNSVNRKAFLIIIIIRIVQQMSGLAAFGMYFQNFFAETESNLSPTFSTLLVIGVQIVMIFVTALFVDRLGRRPLFLFSSLSTSIILATMAVYFYLQQFNDIVLNWLPLVGMIVYIIVMSMGVTVVPNILLSEMLSASIKSEALSISNFIFGIVYASSAKIYQSLEDYVGLYAPFILYSFCCLAGFTFALKFLPETKNRSLEDIQQSFRKSKVTSL